MRLTTASTIRKVRSAAKARGRRCASPPSPPQLAAIHAPPKPRTHASGKRSTSGAKSFAAVKPVGWFMSRVRSALSLPHVCASTPYIWRSAVPDTRTTAEITNRSRGVCAPSPVPSPSPPPPPKARKVAALGPSSVSKPRATPPARYSSGGQRSASGARQKSPPPHTATLRAAAMRSPSLGPFTTGRIMEPVWYSSHVLVKKGTVGTRSTAASKAGSCVPQQQVTAKLVPLKKALRASQPWSKTWPRGDDDPVRRACFPSMLSKVW
mmetsp:Transcript_41907/g.94682  ORF Transcript_41907/g.94682 Transcript_41907/m.94682 type:complete len:266 (+) Transcript_41907:374-1171(+)